MSRPVASTHRRLRRLLATFLAVVTGSLLATALVVPAHADPGTSRRLSPVGRSSCCGST